LGWNNRSLANQYYTSLKEFVKDKLTRMDQLTTLLEIIKKTIKINNCFCERSLEKKDSYNFKRRYSGKKKKHRDPIELDTAYKKP
jgi:predicted house-cleaning noncanonical NTP pyrophosphatase (MazG superfamily)